MCPRISSWINGHMLKRTGELCTVRHFGSLHLVCIEMMDGVPCAGTWAPWLLAWWLRKGMAGWRRTHHGGWRHCAPAHLFIPDGSFFLGKKHTHKKHKHTFMHTQTFCCKSPCTILVCWVFPLWSVELGIWLRNSLLKKLARVLFIWPWWCEGL